MQIKDHSKSDKFFIVVNPSPALTARARELVGGNWAKVQSNGTLVVHNNYRREFKTLVNRENRQSTVINIDLMNARDVEDYADEHFNKYEVAQSFIRHAELYRRLVRMQESGKQVNNIAAERFAAMIAGGSTVGEMEKFLCPDK